MTTVKFFEKNGQIFGFEVCGHSTVSENDSNGQLVCSAVSSAAYLTANTCIEIIGAKVISKVEDGLMSIKLKSMVEKSQVVMEGFKLHVTELAKQYPERITVISEV